MAVDSLSHKQLTHHPLWFNALLLLDAFALGGLSVWRLVLNLLESKMVDPLPPDAIRMLVGIDHTLFPYWVGYTVLVILVVWTSLGSYLWLRTRWRVVPALTILVPLVLLIWLVASRQL